MLPTLRKKERKKERKERVRERERERERLICNNLQKCLLIPLAIC